jgi:dynactin complex subunit
MNKVLLVAVVLTVFLPVFILGSGCEEQGQSDMTKSRLIADENFRLTKKLQQLNRQLDEEIKMLEGCRKEQVMFQKELDDLTTFLTNELDRCKEENLQLQEENKNLKAKLKQP